MSLGDYLRYLRAMRGGPSLQEVAAQAGVEQRTLREIEQRYRAIGDDQTLRRLARYYGVPYRELRWRRDKPRKALSAFVHRAMQRGRTVKLHLRMGRTLEGKVVGWDLGAIGLELADGSGFVMVQRHAVDDWE